MRITVEHVIKFVEGVAARIKEHRDELVQLDSPIGDSDHGVNMDRGFTTVLDKLPTVADKDIGTILKTVGMTLVSTVGGASGPLYGTAFIRAGMALTDRYELTPAEVVVALEAALEGIQARGKAQRGEKTMIDAIGPGVDVLKEAQANGEEFMSAMRRSVAAVEEGMKSTIPMLATKGRASYLGQRSIGHQDPGATSSFYIAQVMLETVEGIHE
ncbi:MAG: dihydroxyacetone kinase subunit L [Chloroflexi bacterium SZAS-1]|nr:dihydroxyacetone kinase subunit L [Chloroflexi bacterium SZAS-1]